VYKKTRHSTSISRIAPKHPGTAGKAWRKEQVQIDQEKIEKAIVDEAVHKFATDDELYTSIRDGINRRIDKVFSEKVSLVVTESVERIVSEGFERSYHKTDGFGRPVGQPTSISKELETMVGNYWTERVES